MANPGATQALLGAFFSGILFNAASAALILYVIGHGSAIFRDGLRLVLILFLASSAAWALVEFLSTVIEPTAPTTCQVAAIFSSIFDQLGRVFVEQYLVWATRGGKKKGLSVVAQVFVLGRFGVGMAFIGLTGSEFNPTCVPVSKVLPVAIIVIALDVLILTVVAIQVLFIGSTEDMAGTRQAPKRSVTLVAIGLAIWIGMSVVLLLGMKTTELVFKTTLPALGLAILVALVTVLSGTLVTSRGPPPRRPDSPTTRDIGRDRDLSSSDSADHPPSRYEDVKSLTTMTMTAYASQTGGTMPSISLPIPQMPGTNKVNVKKSAKGNAWGKASGGKLVISKPVLVEQDGTENPLARIPTVDLATAASNEKERRDKLAQRGSTLIAQRPAPQPPNFSGQNGALAREMSTRRKQVAPSTLAQLERSVSTKTAKTTAGLSVEADASSTSSELSPGAENMRKRSPRQPPAPPISATFQPVRPGEPIRIPIPRPRTPPESPKAEPVKTPLQRRPTTGLPSNPRAQAMKLMANEAKSQRQETVMFVNNIVYDDPNAVNNIVQGASKTPLTSMDSASSVVNRPRPIPRKGDKDRQVFPAELSPSQGHRRSKSGGSIASRKSILQSRPGSPTQLPPLPPPPKSAGNVLRPLPNDTKSMTFDEKMSFLYTTPLSAPSTTAATSKRQSPVPEMPPLPETYMTEIQRTNVEGVSDLEANSERRASKTTDRSSVRTTSVLGIEDLPQGHIERAGSSRKATDELGQSWLPGISPENERKQRPSRDKVTRKSSPVIPAGSRFSMSTMKTDNKARDDDATSAWGSVYSPVTAVNIQQSRLNARSTYIRKESRSSEKQAEQVSLANIPDETIEVMLDVPAHTEDEERAPDDKALQEVPISNFHRRIGEACPTFSSRKNMGRPRKMPPPAPLILYGKSSKRAIIVQASEPSPLESPEAAYQQIQAQLQRIEQPNRESVGGQEQRLVLLENLEREMGQLENKWQTRHDRDSMSSIQTSPSKDSRPTSLAAERRASRRASMRNSAMRSKGEESMGMSSSQSSGMSSESTRASVWQARLAEAQMEYMKSTPDLLMKHNNLNFMSVSKATLGSPSPPDTDESDYEAEVPGSVQPLTILSPKVYEPVIQKHELWRPQSPFQQPVNSGLWVGVAKKAQTTGDVYELPGLSVRPAIRKILGSLTIESSRLWEKSTEISNSRTTTGLWKKHDPSRHMESSRGTTRPVTIRPPRRNRRVTLLPDILENPEPLPDKRGTLGLFQFPWGEKSENASFQPRISRMHMAMPGTMTTGGPSINTSLDARSRQLEAEEFTTSFFDDYEAEEEGDSFDFSDSDGEGDDFDENTLWEIASLLKSENIPSKDSLLPRPLSQQTLESVNSPVSIENATSTIADDYRDDGLVQEEPIPVDRLSSAPPKSDLGRYLLWAPQPGVLEIHTFGLTQPDSTTWKSYITEPVVTVRSNSYIGDITPLQSNKLWEPSAKGDLRRTELLWSTSKTGHSISVLPSAAEKVGTATKSSSLWVRPVVTLTSDISGLFDASHSRADYRRTSKEPAALIMARKPRAMEAPLAKLSSETLWTGKIAAKAPLMWEKPIVAHAFERDGLFDNNKSRLDFRRTTKEPAAISMKRAPRTTKEPLASLRTNSLWSREIIVSQPVLGAQLFTPQHSVVLASQSFKTETNISLWEMPETSQEHEQEGLFDVSITRKDYRTTSKVPAAISMSKKPRPAMEPLPVITTNGLWTGELVAPKIPVSIAEPLSAPEEVPASTLTSSLWEKPMLVGPSSDYEGLFDANIARIDYRRTSKLPAAINMTRKPRKTGEPLAVLMSTELWEMQSELGHVSTQDVSLWIQPTVTMPATTGLFQLDSSRKIYRTTSAEPAALQMVRKPRFVNEPLPKIESTRLWINSQVTSVELDWLTISSVRPRSPSVASISTTSSSSSSPVSDSSSVKTNTTKASSAKSFFKGWFGKKKKEPEFRQVSEDSTSKAAPGIPAVPELPEEFVVKNLDEVHRKKPAQIPLRQLHRPSVAYRADWDGALREAIAASYPGTMTALRASYPQDWEMALQAAIEASHIPSKLTRRPASPRDWSAALHQAIVASYPEIRFSRGQALPAQWTTQLEEAIAKSYPHQVDSFEVTTRHPVFMGAMETTAETIHPAVPPKMIKRRGSYKERNKTGIFDVAVRHPVFFGTMETTAQIVHPAIEEKMLKSNVVSDAVSAPQLWAKPAETEAATAGGLWSSNNSTARAQTGSSFTAEVDIVRHNLVRTKGATRSSGVDVEPDFSEQGMWKRSRHINHDSQSQSRDWLEDSMKKRFTRIELRY
ncbi:hypothetical protein F5Y06DRAFT_209330 [Hypoxylon sp. FL0890]|nr:hypothetical protein F5Y06DRAFT_209330 [Hypoxylon sp. FL0890]